MIRESPKDLRRSIATALDRLEEAFGVPRPGRPRSPLDELVLTILSQSTSDRNRDAAYRALRRRFPTWGAVARARPGAIEEAIRIGGLSRGKSRVIHDALRRIALDHGSLSLDVLKRWPAERARNYLLEFRGVGEKTAACVLLFACRKPAFPVDTHVERIIRRLGWVGRGATPAAMHALLERDVPARRHYSGHINLITLGRRLCRPRRPACHLCPLRRMCRFARGVRPGAGGAARPGRRFAAVARSGRGTGMRRFPAPI